MMEAALKQLANENAQALSDCLNDVTTGQQHADIVQDKVIKLVKETVDTLEIKLKEIKDSCPNIKSASDFNTFRFELRKLVEGHRRTRDAVAEEKQEKSAAKAQQDLRLVKLKDEINILLDSNRALEENLKPENLTEQTPILRLMGSLAHVPKAAIANDANEKDDSIAKHLESLLKQVEDL